MRQKGEFVQILFNFHSTKSLLEFNANDPGEKYCEFIITEGTTAPLIDLPDDAPLPDFYDRSLFAKYVVVLLLSHCD